MNESAPELKSVQVKNINIAKFCYLSAHQQKIDLKLLYNVHSSRREFTSSSKNRFSCAKELTSKVILSPFLADLAKLTPKKVDLNTKLLTKNNPNVDLGQVLDFEC